MTIRFIFFMMLLVQLISCSRKEEELSTDPSLRLSFSEDTVFFDTIFSSVGSVTKRVLIYNNNSSRIHLSSIQLAGGANSSYSIIVNGRTGPSVSDLDILGKDSMYVLIKVLIDPSSQNLPFLVSDSILVSFNGNQQQIHLEAYGQDAHFFRKETIACNSIWPADKPYVLYDTVRVAAGCSLTIQEGCNIYAHDGALLEVAGTLLIQGTSGNPVFIASDKTGESYTEKAGLWNGILFRSSSLHNAIDWCTIRNAKTTLQLENVADGDTIAELSLRHVQLLHASARMIDAGNTDLYAENVLLANCPRALLSQTDGCSVWKHCTFADYSVSFFREEPALLIGSGTTSFKGYFINTILWGDRSNELTVAGTPFISVASSIWKSTSFSQSVNTLNQNPQFKNIYEFNYSLKTGSPAIDLCIFAGITDDLTGFPRDAVPDAGAYEFH